MTQSCPSCGHLLDSDMVVNGKQASPKPDDMGICIQCGVYLVFNKDLSRRKMTDVEFNQLPAQLKHQLRLARQIIYKSEGEKIS